MLTELTVANFAIIRELAVSFAPGLTMITGETGAGKSILVGAVNLLLGGRASQEMIRTGAETAEAAALFTLSAPGALAQTFETLGLDPAPEVLIRRAVSRSGRSRATVNGRLVTAGELQSLARRLVSVSGQHEHQLLLDPGVHLLLLDAFGGLDPRREAVAALFTHFEAAREQLSALRKSRADRAERRDLHEFQLRELEAARLEPGEDEALEREREVLRHAETLAEAARRAHQGLYAGRGAALELLQAAARDIAEIIRIDPSREPLAEHVEQARIHLEEAAHDLRDYAARIAHDPARLAGIEDRLALLRRLWKKYGGSLAAALDRRETLRAALAADEDSAAEEDALARDLTARRAAWLDAARELSTLRREAAGRLAQEIAARLAALDMPRARFAARFAETPETPAPAATGLDTVEFLLSANPGEDLKPLARIASGGELSRILLAVKGILSLSTEAETLIFDEVDAGIGGRTAELVGRELARLADRHQVICITHLPQIACYGPHHLKVQKHADTTETHTTVSSLPPDDRVEEIARMLGGVSITPQTRAHARECLLRAAAEGEE